MQVKTFFSKGALNMMQATIWFALMNVFAKLVNHLPTMEVVFFRCMVSLSFSFALIKIDRLSLKTKNYKLLLARGISGTIALYLYFLSLHNMPLGTAVTIQYISPVFTVIIAMIFLKEKVTLIQWLFFIVSFCGVFLIKGFDNRVATVFLVAGIVSAFFSGVSYNLVRTLRNNEKPQVIVFHFMLLGTITGFIFSINNWVMPVGIEWFYLFMIGLCTQLAQMKMTRSLQIAEIGEVSILNYLGVIYALIIGWLMFDESYGINTIIGILLVVTGVVLNILYTSKEKNKVA